MTNCDHLYFQIGGMPNESQELIISASGNVAHFHEVEALLSAAPQIANWKFIAFIPPADSLFITEYEGRKFDPELMWFDPVSNGEEPSSFGIVVYLKEYDDQKRSHFHEGVWRVLDTLLGEKSAGLDINFLEVEKLIDNPEDSGVLNLIELPAYLSWRAKQT